MFCPQCLYEYKADVKTCPDCNIALVDEDPITDDGQGDYIKYNLNYFEFLKSSKIIFALSKSSMFTIIVPYFFLLKNPSDTFECGNRFDLKKL